MNFPRVDSEVGQLREVIVHRPGRELGRLTPGNHTSLLFDDLLDIRRAQDDHDRFSDMLRERGVHVWQFKDLLMDTLRVPQARDEVLKRTLNERRLGPVLTPAMAQWASDLDAQELASLCIEGMTVEEWKQVSPIRSLVTKTLLDDDFLIRPLPNHLFTRDASAWIHRGVAVNSMSSLARERESLHYSVIYRYHPRFAKHHLTLWSRGTSGAIRSTEGGDALVLDSRVVMFGVSERTTAQGVERIALKVLQAEEAQVVIAVILPHSRALMHLDTAFTQVDTDAFLMYPGLGTLQCFILTLDGQRLNVQSSQRDLPDTVQHVLDRPVRFISPTGSPAQIQREQWNDGFNALALQPGVVMTYDRAPLANEALRRADIDVVEMPGSELGRGRGGPRCMSCPISRDPLPA